MEFEWDEHNLFHISMHGLTREDVETAFLGRSVFVRDEFRNGEERRSYLGRDRSRRILLVVTTQRRQRMRVVTAFRAGYALREYYFARTGERDNG